MKKLRFLLVSAVLAGVSFVANATDRVVTQFTGRSNDGEQIEEQSQQQLVLQPAFDLSSQSKFWSHSSHSSHCSHSSHSSHSSHRSHYSSR